MVVFICKYIVNSFDVASHWVNTHNKLVKSSFLEFTKKHGAFPADACLCEAATFLQRANSTHVRLKPFFNRLDVQRKFSMRNDSFK